MKVTAVALAGTLVAGSLPACQSTALAPTPSAQIPSATASNISGMWNGTGSDSYSPELVTWVLTQSGTSVTGTVEFKPLDASDGSCASCHKVKKGTFSGTLSGSALSVAMNFPAGGDVPTPICVADLNGTATVGDRRITATYSGTDTCEGLFADGKIELSRP
jgi:hypothetical protein